MERTGFFTEPHQIAVKTINDRLEASITSSASDAGLCKILHHALVLSGSAHEVRFVARFSSSCLRPLRLHRGFGGRHRVAMITKEVQSINMVDNSWSGRCVWGICWVAPGCGPTDLPFCSVSAWTGSAADGCGLPVIRLRRAHVPFMPSKRRASRVAKAVISNLKSEGLFAAGTSIVCRSEISILVPR